MDDPELSATDIEHISWVMKWPRDVDAEYSAIEERTRSVEVFRALPMPPSQRKSWRRAWRVQIVVLVLSAVCFTCVCLAAGIVPWFAVGWVSWYMALLLVATSAVSAFCCISSWWWTAKNIDHCRNKLQWLKEGDEARQCHDELLGRIAHKIPVWDKITEDYRRKPLWEKEPVYQVEGGVAIAPEGSAPMFFKDEAAARAWLRDN